MLQRLLRCTTIGSRCHTTTGTPSPGTPAYWEHLYRRHDGAIARSWTRKERILSLADLPQSPSAAELNAQLTRIAASPNPSYDAAYALFAEARASGVLFDMRTYQLMRDLVAPEIRPRLALAFADARAETEASLATLVPEANAFHETIAQARVERDPRRLRAVAEAWIHHEIDVDRTVLETFMEAARDLGVLDEGLRLMRELLVHACIETATYRDLLAYYKDGRAVNNGPGS